MKITSRAAAVAVGLAIGTVTTVGLAAAASAAYSSTPSGPIGWTPNGAVHATVVSGNRVYVGGAFTGGVAALNAATGALVWTGHVNGDVRALALSSDGAHLLAGGNFTQVDGLTHRKLASLLVGNGSVEPGWKASAGGTVRDLVVSGDTLYFGGVFTRQNGQVQGGLGAVTVSTGKLVSAFKASANNDVFGLTLSGTRLVIAGSFTQVNGLTRNSLASVDTSTNALQSWAPARLCSICNQYWDVVVDNNTAFVGTSGNRLGAFDMSTGAARFHVNATGDVQALTVSGGVLYAGGHFGAIGNQTHTILAALSERTGAVDASFNPRFVTAYPGIWALAASPTKLYAGGAFTAAGPTPPKRYPYFAMFSLI
jgi:outer membrane protein assembly factor BamB